MAADYFQMDDALPARGLWAVSVPWHLVPLLSALPGARQMIASLYLDPPEQKAAVVLWPGVDPRFALALLAKLDAQRQRRAKRSRAPR